MNMHRDWKPRRFSPVHLRICTLHWSGLPADEIALLVGRSPQTVSNVLNTQEAMDILTELTARTLDTVLDVQTEAQAFAPAALHEKARLMLGAKDERVRNMACSDILAIAGHQPVRRIQIERPDPVAKRYESMTDEEIRLRVMREVLGDLPVEDPSEETLH